MIKALSVRVGFRNRIILQVVEELHVRSNDAHEVSDVRTEVSPYVVTKTRDATVRDLIDIIKLSGLEIKHGNGSDLVGLAAERNPEGPSAILAIGASGKRGERRDS